MPNKQRIREMRMRLEALSEEALTCLNRLDALQMEIAQLILQMREVATRLQVLEPQSEGDRLGEMVRMRFRL